MIRRKFYIMENQLSSDVTLKRFKRAIIKYRYLIYISTILAISAGLVYLKYQVSIYKAYSIIKVKGERESKNINSVLDIYSYGDGG